MAFLVVYAKFSNKRQGLESVNALKVIEFCNLHGQVLWYLNYISIYLLFKKIITTKDVIKKKLKKREAAAMRFVGPKEKNETRKERSGRKPK